MPVTGSAIERDAPRLVLSFALLSPTRAPAQPLTEGSPVLLSPVGHDDRMRVLFSSPSALGHVHPMVPLARAFQHRGHDVRWATGPDACNRVEQAGITAVPIGLSAREGRAEYWRRYPDAKDLPGEQLPAHMFPKMFGAVNTPPRFADLLPLTRQWRPAMVVHDAAEFAGPIAAAAIGVPHITHAYGALVPEARVAAAAEEVAPLWAEVGLEPRPYGGSYDHLYLDIYPPALQPPGGDHVGRRQLLRPVPFDGSSGEGLPPEFAGNPDWPVVYLTFGTVFNDNDTFRAALAGIRDLNVRLIVTVGPDADPVAFGSQPTNVVLERYIPQTLLLPVCDVVASHAGSGTVLASLGFGIPQLCMPQAADQFANAAAVTNARAGIAIRTDRADPATIADAVSQLLHEPDYRRNSRIVADQIASMPTPDSVAALLESFA